MIQILLLLALSAVGASEAELAERYLSALYAQDLETLRAITTEDLLFIDDTAAFLGAPLRFERRQAVIDFFSASLQLVESSRFEKIRSFTSGEQTILELDYVAIADGQAFNAPGTRLELRVAGVTVITVRDGKVVEHRDFIDYPAMMSQIEEQKSSEAGGEKNPSP